MAPVMLPALKKLTLESETEPKPESRLLEILLQYPICDRFLSHLEITDIFTVQLISKQLSRNINSHLQNRWDINRRLKRFVGNPKAFRSQLGSSQAVISGSFAIQYFDDVLWKESDLDVYVTDGKGASVLGHYLERKEGYKQVADSNADGEEYIDNVVVKTITYTKSIKDKQTTKIQLVLTVSTPVQAIMSSFYSSAVMNMITWNKAYSMFPVQTFIQRKAYMLRELLQNAGQPYEGQPPQIKRYMDRGWTFPPKEESEILLDSTKPPGRPRWIGDKHCWTIDLNTDGVQPNDPQPDYVMRGSHFNLYRPTTGSSLLYIQCEEFTSSILKYTYTSSSTYPRERNFWYTYMLDRMDEIIKREFNKIPKDLRTDMAQRIVDNQSSLSWFKEFEKGEDWRYFDGAVDAWMDRYERWDPLKDPDESERLRRRYATAGFV